MKPGNKKIDPFDPSRRLDRIQWFRSSRWFAGLSIDPDFKEVTVALLRSTGWGKYLKFALQDFVRYEIPAAISSSAKKIAQQSSDTAGRETVSAVTVQQVSFDITEQLQHAINLLKSECGAISQQLLVAAIHEPGIWKVDFDGQKFYSTICNGQKLAQESGLSIVDSLPQSDLAVAGRGDNLDALAIWFLLADRSEPIASTWRLLVDGVSEFRLLLLPPSDGLDAEFPRIEMVRSNRNTLAREISRIVKEKKDLPLEVIWATGDAFDYAADLQLDRNSCHLLSDLLCEQGQLSAITTAVIAAFFVDQVPSSLPWLTGCDLPRILGRISPGRPSNWRRLIEQMADNRPAAMKLREAV